MINRAHSTPLLPSAPEPLVPPEKAGSPGGASQTTAAPGRTGLRALTIHPRLQRRLALLLLLLAATLYIRTIGYDFVWDDFLMVVQNQYFKHIRYLPLYFTSDFARLTSGGLPAVYYRPLFALSFLIDFWLWGNNPSGYHLTNLLLFLVVVWLVFVVSRCLFADARVALLAMGLFTLHPIHVEPVAWVSARPDVLAALGMLLALLGYHRFRQGTGPLRWLALGGSLLAFAFGLLSKEMAVSLPAILLWYDIVWGRREMGSPTGRVWPRLLLVLPHLAFGLGFLWFRWAAIQSLAPTGLGPGILWQRLPGALEVMGRYTVLGIWPFRMQPAYLQARPESLAHPWSLVGLAIAGVSLVALLAWQRRRPEAGYALGWYLLTLAPVADLAPLAPRPVNMADRYLFIPSLGICWLLALGGIALWDHALARSRRIATAFLAAAGGLLLAWTGSALTYAEVWRDNVTLFERIIRDNPSSPFGYNNLGLALVRVGRIPDAIRILETAVRLDPQDVDSQLSLARTYVENDRAAEGFRILDRLKPQMEHDKMYVMVRARAHMAVEEWESAGQVLLRGLQSFPDLAEGHQALGFVLERQGRVQEALEAYRKAVRLRPDLLQAYLGLARIYLQRGDMRGAASAARAALDLDPNSAVAWQALALVLEATGNPVESRQAWGRVLELEDSPAAIAEARRHLSKFGREGRLP